MDVNRLLNEFLGPQTGARSGDAATSQSRAGLPQGLAGGAAAGGLVALLLGTKKGRKMGGKALKYGGLAAVGGLAYKAYRDWQTQQPSGQESNPLSLPRPPADSGFDLENDTDASGQDFRLSVMKAMISAAKSDDHIDAEEHARIHARIDDLGLGASEKAAMFDYFAAPADPVATAGLARTTEQKAEIYLASALAIDPDTVQEQAYLDALSNALDLPQGLRGHLDLEAAAARREAETA